jgi:hypothetical protein
VDALAQHVKAQGRAFSVFEGAKLILDGGDRHRAKFECEAERLVGLYHVPSDGSLFETREDAFRHLLRSADAMAPFYKAEDVELEEPKGNFTSVAVCSLSGEILGPPSHHSFQTSLKRLHTERFANMPLEAYKKRIDTKTDAELVEKWKESQKKGQRWVYQKGEVAEGAEPLSFNTRAEMEAHFRKTHSDEGVVEVREALVSGAVKREQLSSGLGRLYLRELDFSKKKMFDVAQRLGTALERRGLKLFKRRAGKMFVSKTKPLALDPSVALSDRIRAIVEAVRAEPGIQALKLLEVVSPSPAAEPTPAPEAGAEEASAAPATKQLTDDQRAVIKDLHWLADAGYVIEYADGCVFLGVQNETHKEPKAKKPRPEKAAGEEAATESTEESSEDSEIAEEASAEAEDEGVAEEVLETVAQESQEASAATPEPEAQTPEAEPSA